MYLYIYFFTGKSRALGNKVEFASLARQLERLKPLNCQCCKLFVTKDKPFCCLNCSFSNRSTLLYHQFGCLLSLTMADLRIQILTPLSISWWLLVIQRSSQTLGFLSTSDWTRPNNCGFIKRSYSSRFLKGGFVFLNYHFFYEDFLNYHWTTYLVLTHYNGKSLNNMTIFTKFGHLSCTKEIV